RLLPFRFREVSARHAENEGIRPDTQNQTTTNGEWAVVQQGLNDRSGMARRYHWRSATVRDFVVEPHTGIAGENQGGIMNLVDPGDGWNASENGNGQNSALARRFALFCL